jgi:hypothetical protein
VPNHKWLIAWVEHLPKIERELIYEFLDKCHEAGFDNRADLPSSMKIRDAIKDRTVLKESTK